MALTLHHETIGSGPEVVVLHGLFGAGRNWLSVARRLSERFRFHLVDLRNHGRSPHAASMSYTDMAGDVEALCKRLTLTEINLVGHSMGGKVAMTLALTSSRGIRRLINVDIAPVAYPDRFADMIAAMRALDLSRIRRRSEADLALTDAIPETAVRQFILQNLVFTQGVASWRANLPALQEQMPEILGPLPVPEEACFRGDTCFIRGELSDRIRPEHLPLMSRWFPAHRLATVHGGGHWPHAEAPEQFLEIFTAALTHTP